MFDAHPLDFLYRQACQTPDQPALIHAHGTFTYKTLHERVSQAAGSLIKQGLRPKDRVLVCLPNGPDFVITYLAIWQAGLTIIPINTALPEDDKNYIKTLCRPQLVIDAAHCDLLQTEATALPFQATDSIPHDIYAIFFTSGTTNRPKGVCHSRANLLANVLAFNHLTGLNAQTRLLHVLPMGYMAGFLNTILAVLAAGGTTILMEPFSPGTALRFWSYARTQQINAVWLSPTMLAVLIEMNRGNSAPEWAKTHLKHLFVGMAPLPLIIKQKFEELFSVVCLESYGMTEVLFVSSNTHHHPRVERSVGQLLSGVSCQIRAVQADTMAGELWIQSPYAMLGYLDGETGLMATGSNHATWFDSGDIAHLDEQGNLFIVARKKDLIIHGGVNVTPGQVEEVLMRHPSIAEAAVVGVAHDFWGEEVVAFLVLHPSTPSDNLDEELWTLCKQHLIKEAVPARFIQLKALPRSSTGKIQKNQLRTMA